MKNKNLIWITFIVSSIFSGCGTPTESKTENEIKSVDSTTVTADSMVQNKNSEDYIRDTMPPKEEANAIVESVSPKSPPPPPPVADKVEIETKTSEIEEVVETEDEVPSIYLFFQVANSFFAKHVSNGKVDYSGIKANPKQLNDIVELAKTSKPGSGNTYKAFYINAYNVMTIKGIVDNYPTESPLDIKGFFKENKYNVAGEMLTLDQIENVKLRKQFDDARIHFVVVCGAVSCPPIINQAYTASNVNSLMTKQTKNAVNKDFFVKVDDDTKEVAVSMIMKWYKEDFVKDGQTTIDYLNKYRKTPIPADYTVTYQEYDWKVNGQ